MLLKFDWTITLGALVASIIIVAGTWAAVSRLYSMLEKRLSLFEVGLGVHTQTLINHATRMEKQDDLMLKLVGDMQRVIGRMEQWTAVNDYRREKEFRDEN